MFTHVVVDAANVVGSRPDGWWRDRAGAARRLAGELVATLVDNPRLLAEALGVPGAQLRVHLVLEGAARRAVPDSTASRAVPDITARRAVPDSTASRAVPDSTASRAVPDGAFGPVLDLPTHPHLQVHHADADGDPAIAALAARLAPDVVVVTADRGLRARVRAAGARVAGPSTLLGALPG